MAGQKYLIDGIPHDRAFQAILDSLDEGVVTLSDAGNVVGINRAACEILEVDRSDALERGCLYLMGEEVCAQGSVVRQSIADRKPIQHLEADVHTRSGQQKVLDVRTRILRDDAGSAHGGLILFRDVSELVQLRRDLQQRYRLHNVIGKSKAMREVFTLVEQVADADATVLIEGETGTGKELVARAIHHLSPRAAGPFVAINCSALPESLLESELFGHVKGAFTGATRDKIGRFEAAAGGTIFLDEIGDVSHAIQVKLLRVLQERTIERVGAETSTPVDIRVISATNHPLAELVQRGSFRQDLLYRLRVVPIQLPPLRARRADILLLAQHFIEHFRSTTGWQIDGLDAKASTLLVDHTWPGNVRELENAIEYAFVKARQGAIGRTHLPPEITEQVTAIALHPHAAGTPGPSKRERLSRESVSKELTETGWNISKAARRLGVSRTTLYKRITEYGLTEPHP